LFGGLFMLILSVPLVLVSLAYLFCGYWVLRRNKAARYWAMALCFLLTPFASVVIYFSGPGFRFELRAAVFVLSMYLLGVLIWKWDLDAPRILSIRA
jgi:hypothetical protein